MVRPFRPTEADEAKEVPDGPLRLDGGAPVALAAGEVPWQVEEGEVEVYLVWPEGRRLVSLAQSGDFVFPLASSDRATLRLIAPGGAALSPSTPDPEALAQAADRWLREASENLGGGLPSNGRLIDPGENLEADAGDVLANRTGGCWVTPSHGQALCRKPILLCMKSLTSRYKWSQRACGKPLANSGVSRWIEIIVCSIPVNTGWS